MIILDENHKEIDFLKIERPEQILAQKYILPHDTVLELGGRYGSVSCTINPMLKNPTKHLVVEPDDRVWECLTINKTNNRCHFHIIKGCISNNPMKRYYPFGGQPKPNQYATGYMVDQTGDTNIYALSDLQQEYGISSFTVLIADCEGCFPVFITENTNILFHLRLIILEKDIPKNNDYAKSDQILYEHHFKQIDFRKPHHYVYSR